MEKKYYDISWDIVDSDDNINITFYDTPNEKFNAKNNSAKRAVEAINIETGEVLYFESASAGEYFITHTKKNTEKVVRCCKGHRKTYAGYIWRYYESD